MHLNFKIATLVYMFLHSGHPSYFVGVLFLLLFLSSNWGRYSTKYNLPDKKFFEDPQFYRSVHTSPKHFGQSFVFDAPDEVCFRKRLKIVYLQNDFNNIAYNGIHGMIFFNWILELSLRVCLSETKHHKIT